MHEGRALKELDAGCCIKRRPDSEGIIHKREVVFLATPAFEKCFAPFNHHACSCNELIAISNRVCGVVPQPTSGGLKKLRCAAKILSQCLPEVTPWDSGQLPLLYGGLKRRRYEEAERRVREGGLTAKDASITMFIKDERLSPLKHNPDPRAIQFRDSRYCVELARYLKPIEHNLYNLVGAEGTCLPTTRMVGKGLNQVQRAKLLRRKLSMFRRPVTFSLDMSRFDQHCSKELLEVEHSVYKHCLRDKHFSWLLALQLFNRCFTKNGFVYATRGKRMSGDMNTALGNCIIMICMVIAMMTDLPGVKWDILDDGDDCLLIVEMEDEERVRAACLPAFLEFGHECKIEHVAYSLPEVSWCQSSPIEYATGKWKFVRDPFKTMSCDLVGSKWKCDLESRKRLLASLGLCELILNLGVPILQSYALAIMRSSCGAKPYSTGDFFSSSLAIRAMRELKTIDPKGINKELHTFNMKHLNRLGPQAIATEARVSFAAAFGVTIDEQIEMEKCLDKWTIELTGDVLLTTSRDVATWIDHRAYFPERYL